MADNAKTPRPVYRNIHVTDIATYRLPPAGIVSILHRISGAIMFLLMPFIIWMFDTSVSTEISYGEFTSVFTGDFGWFFRLIALGLIWAYLHHFVSGVRHLIMDATHTVSKEQGKSSAIVTLVIGTGLTLVLALKLFGVF